ncbi:MAG: alpha/beta hydrolase, partial [Desulfobacterales bacterium]
MNPTTDREPVEGFVETPEGGLHHLDWGGGGPQIHFLHANGFCAGTYTPFLRYLVADFHVFASDVRGHGGSTFSGARRIRH